MSLIASVLKLDRAAVKALRITDPYSLHRVVYGLYPDVRDASGKAVGYWGFDLTPVEGVAADVPLR